MPTEPEAGTFLALLGADDRRKLDALGRLTRFPRGTRLMHEGEPGDRVVVLLEGHVKATSVTPEGNELVLSFRGPGDLLGELSFLDTGSRATSVTAIEPVEARVLTAEGFRAYLERTPGAAMTMIDALAL